MFKKTKTPFNNDTGSRNQGPSNTCLQVSNGLPVINGLSRRLNSPTNNDCEKRKHITQRLALLSHCHHCTVKNCKTVQSAVSTLSH